MDSKALAVQRFDRGQGVGSIHMEDFAQVFGLYPRDKYHHRSYANIASVIRAGAGEENTYESFRRFGTVRRNCSLGCESIVKTCNRYR
jgi:serine/threonine-protein kinase HipA